MTSKDCLAAAVAEGKALAHRVSGLALEDQVEALNQIRQALHSVSPFAQEPVDCVLWVLQDKVEANDYNPNTVASPEMRLLEHSIREDGYTQPIVTVAEGSEYTVIDGFHRNRVGKECSDVREQTAGYLPVTVINAGREAREDRIAATIRHNRARGRHQVQAMSEIVQELARRNWTEAKIARELGMDADEVLRLKQIGGLAEMFADQEFSEAWEVSPL